MSTTQTALILSLISTIGLVAAALVALSKRISESECCCCKARFSRSRSSASISVSDLEKAVATDQSTEVKNDQTIITI